MTGGATRRLVVEADGGSRGNPGVAGYGALVRSAEGDLLIELAEPLGQASNNVAEYSGLIAGLGAAAEIDPGADVEVLMDSKLVVEQMSGRWKIKHEDMRRLALEARDLCDRIRAAGGSVEFRWIPRADNVAADALSNEGMDGNSVRRVHLESTRDAAIEPTRDAAAEPTNDPTPASATPVSRRDLRLLLVQVPADDCALPGIVEAVRRLVGEGTRVASSSDPLAVHVATELGTALHTVPEVVGGWAGHVGSGGADATVTAAYDGLREEGGTAVVVTTRRGVLSVLTQVLDLPTDRFWTIATAPGSLSAVEVWADGTASVAFTNRTDHLA